MNALIKHSDSRDIFKKLIWVFTGGVNRRGLGIASAAVVRTSAAAVVTDCGARWLHGLLFHTAPTNAARAESDREGRGGNRVPRRPPRTRCCVTFAEAFVINECADAG